MIPDTLFWWITAIDIPVMTGFVVAFNRLRNGTDNQIAEMRERLNAYKLEVAQNYASINHVKDLESRLIAHLLRIETKLDNTTYRINKQEN